MTAPLGLFDARRVLTGGGGGGDGAGVGGGHCWLDWLPTGVVKDDLPGLLVVAVVVAASGHAELTDGFHAGCKASGQTA